MGTHKKPVTAKTELELDAGAVVEAQGAVTDLSSIEAAVLFGQQVGTLSGRIQAAELVRHVSVRVILESYRRIQPHLGEMLKIGVPMPDGSRKHVSDREEFCQQTFGIGDRRIRQLMQDEKALGAEAFEQAQRLGLSHRNYVAIRGLPEEMRSEVRQALDTGNKDEVLSVLEDLAARNAALATKAEESEKTLAARDRVIEGKDKKINKLLEADEIRRNGTPNERERLQLADVRDVGTAAELALMRLVAVVDEVTANPATDAAELQARQTADWVAQRFADLFAERGIAVDVLGERVEPGWRRELQAQIDAAQEAAPARGRRKG